MSAETIEILMGVFYGVVIGLGVIIVMEWSRTK